MIRRANRLALLALAVMSVTLYYGCSQTDDIVTPVSTTVLTLDASLLPTPPDGMVYELWVNNGDAPASIGRFRYNQVTKQYLTESGQVRTDGNKFRFSGDVLSFDEIFLSVENSPDGDPSSPANVMLWDRVTNPTDDPLQLVFPDSDSLWFATCNYAIETPSDSDKSANEGSGIWFAQYTVKIGYIQDTFALDTFFIKDSTLSDTAVRSLVDIVVFDVEETSITLGFDTIDYTHVLHEKVYAWDSVAPYYELEDSTLWTLGPVRSHWYETFTQGAEGYGLVDYSQYGFQYRGWVVSNAITTASVGGMTPPAWDLNLLGSSSLEAVDGGIISTGAFVTAGVPDDGNPYSLGPRVPPFPGEDFLQNLPNGAGTINLLPAASGNRGFVFVSLEPTNFDHSETNFPLLAFWGPLPSNQSALDPEPQDGNPPDSALVFPMRNLSGTADPVQGFPKIQISIERF